MYNGGILGVNNEGGVNLESNKYIIEEVDSKSGFNGYDDENNCYNGYSRTSMKDELYKWASGTSYGQTAGAVFVNNTSDAPYETIAYSTIAPVETNKGYEGYGVLWWELEGYSKQTFYVYDNQGVAIYPPTLHIEGGTVTLPIQDYYYNKDGKNYHAYQVMLKTGKTYPCSATNTNYTGGTTENITVTAEEEIWEIYIGTRANYVFARECNTANGSVSGEIYIPEGDYYIIMSGGGGAACWTMSTLQSAGASAAGFIGLVHLNEGTYNYKIGGPGKASSSGPSSGLESYLELADFKITTTGGEHGKKANEDAAGGTLSLSDEAKSCLIGDPFIYKNGFNAKATDAATTNKGSGEKSVLTSGELAFNEDIKYGAGGGYGIVAGQPGHVANRTGMGGCLYIFSKNVYSICDVQLPDDYQDATINLSVSNDGLQADDENVFDGAALGETVGNINGRGSKKFIVKKGATINYDVVSNDGHWIANGTITNVGTPERNLGTYNPNTNTHTIDISLNKRILTHTISSAGNNITVTGDFTDSNGNIISNKLTGTGSITFNVWSAEPKVTYTVSRTYYDYDTKSGSINVTTDKNNGTTPISLEKTKYYVDLSKVTYAHSANWGSYKWNSSNKINFDDNDYDNAYMYSNQSATITISSVNGLPNNWTMYLNGCYGDSAGSPKIEVSINGTTKISENISKDKNNNYSIEGNGTEVNNIVIKFTTPKYIATNIYLDAIYFEVRD